MRILEKLGKTVTIRPHPEARGYLGELGPGHIIEVEDELYADLQFPESDNHKWYKILGAEGYVNAVYPTTLKDYQERYKKIKELPEDGADYYILFGYLENGTQVSETRLERVDPNGQE